MAYTLLEPLEQVPDFRRAEGLRYPLGKLLLMMILSMMSGRYGYREISCFLRSNAAQLAAELELTRQQMPSHVTVRTVLLHIDFAALADAFCAWAAQHVAMHAGELVAGDGKALASTVSDYDTAQQDFVCLVSLFCQRQGAVVALARYHNGHQSEVPTLEQVIAAADLHGVTYTIDALHCKKNSPAHHRRQQRLPGHAEAESAEALPAGRGAQRA